LNMRDPYRPGRWGDHPARRIFSLAVLLVGGMGCVRPPTPPETTRGPQAPARAPLPPGSQPLSGELSVFFAASLDQVLAEMKTAFEQAHPGVQVRAEASGSQVAARKVSEYGRTADLVLTADWEVIEALLRPAHAAWNIGFASNEIVLAYRESSRYAAEINADNWPEVLLRKEVRVARLNEDLAPLGYQTLLLWKLAERYYAPLLAGRPLHDALKQRASGNLVRADVLDVLPLLGPEVDYTFTFRSVAQAHHLPFIELPPEINLSDPAQAKRYAQVSTTYHNGTETVQVTGQPIVYGATIPAGAPNAPAAESFLALLLGPTGRKILQGQGFRPLVPARCRGIQAVPPALRPLVEPWPPE